MTFPSPIIRAGRGAVLPAERRRPFADADTAEVWDRARRGAFDRTALRAKGIPQRLAEICLRAMAADPGDRHASAEELATDLEHYESLYRHINDDVESLGASAPVLGVKAIIAWISERQDLPEKPLEVSALPRQACGREVVLRFRGDPMPSENILEFLAAPPVERLRLVEDPARAEALRAHLGNAAWEEYRALSRRALPVLRAGLG